MKDDRKTKCGACGKYSSSTECVRCTKCPGAFHRACVALPAGASVGVSWMCPGCKSKIPKEGNSTTPVKGITATYSVEPQPRPGPSSSSSNKDAVMHDTTQVSNDGLAAEIRAFREVLSAVRTEIREFRSEVTSFQSSLKACNDRIESVEIRLVTLERKLETSVPPNVDALEDTISELRQELNHRDQELLLNDVHIAGIPECPDDNLIRLVKLLAVKVGQDVQDCDIVHVERVGVLNRNLNEKNSSGASLPPRPRNIVVKFARRITRDQLLKAARVRRAITSSDLELQGAPSRIYVNERLTRTNRQLFAKTREAARRAHFKYVWTKEGKIFTRKEDGRTAERIRSEKDVAKIFGTDYI